MVLLLLLCINDNATNVLFNAQSAFKFDTNMYIDECDVLVNEEFRDYSDVSNKQISVESNKFNHFNENNSFSSELPKLEVEIEQKNERKNMSIKSEKDKSKQIQDKCQSVINALLKDEDNKYCVDCDSKGPRWASWNLGVFLCIRCAGIHRNLGVHISKVKSVNLDTWTPEQVVSLQQMGNSRARAVYEANLPDNFRRPQNDSSLESFIRAKYEHKKYIAREWVPLPLPKVNWEKEIDEEIEKQRRKKKTSMEKKHTNMIEVPQLPKPKASSPKSVRSPVVTNNENKQSTDLFGLQNGEDSFSSFVSATTTVEETKKTETDILKSEEESFFNQISPAEKEKVKLTKDNILALYGNGPSVNNFSTTYQNQSNFCNNQSFQGFTGYPQTQNLQGQTQNGVTQFPVATQIQQFPGQIYQASPPLSQFLPNNQFRATLPTQNTNTQYAPTANSFYPQNGINLYPNPNNTTQGVTSNQYQPQNLGVMPQNSVANPFFASQGINVQQQFANLSLNNKPPNAGPTLATNLWP
ncbi:hypothetical protein RN001_002178 [Aquatica leii]|uniref:Arf-GAP domain-containing protein n=1 Tax=Aquatica leii TaxID=1421715 RepID=A0AAN7Q8F8_9COLE|nr:hypothetical protein RN001_002178 [Aquatica leii]